MIREMALFTYFYPTQDDPKYAFIRPVVCGLTELGIHVSVIAPQSLTNSLKRSAAIRPRHWTDHTDSGKVIDVYQPHYISFSHAKLFGWRLTYLPYAWAAKKVFKRLPKRPDILYAHFWESVACAASVMGKDKIPLVAVSGEEHISVYENYPRGAVKATVEKVSGLICVSTKNLNECASLGLSPAGMKTVVLPNAVNGSEFYKMDRRTVRRELGWPEDRVIAIFVGWFIERKGVNRVVEAARGVPELKLALVGAGEAVPPSDQIIFQGKLPHDQIGKYLNAADFFVLPTLAEGCCNAIVEAMACGLPVISSALPFNDDLLDAGNSLRIDPKNIAQITGAMKTLTEDAELRARLSAGAEKTAAALSIEKRAVKIAEFLEACRP